MKRIFLLFLAFLLIGNISAEFLSVKTDVSITKDSSILIGTEEIAYKDIWTKYQPIEIKDVLGLGNTLFKGAITNHTETCGDSCLSEMTIYLPYESVLIEDLIFYKIVGTNKEKRNIRSWNLQYYGLIDDYENVCVEGKQLYDEKNETYYTPVTCSNVLVGNHYGWIDYKIGDKMKAGTYKVRLIGSKNPSWNVDWVIKTQGKTLDEWATWGNISTGSQAEVILNSPANGSTQYNSSITFNSSVNLTGGSFINNLSFFDNNSGFNLRSNWVFNYSLNKIGEGCDYLGVGTCKGITIINNYLSNVTSCLSAAGTSYPIYVKVGFLYYNGTEINTSEQSHNDVSCVNKTFLNPNNNTLIKNVTLYLRSDTMGSKSTGTPYMYGYKPNYIPESYFERNYIAGQNIKWNVQACDSDGDCGFATSNYTFTIDSIYPQITLNYPTSLLNYGVNNTSLQLNITATDTNLDKVWYNYNGTNTTLSKNITFTGTNSTTSTSYILAKNITIGDSISTIYSHITSTDGANPAYLNTSIIYQNGTRINYENNTGGGNSLTISNSLPYTNVKIDRIELYLKSTNGAVTAGLVNTTITSNNTYFLSNITLTTQKNVTIYANDTAGNLNATTFSWDYKVFENNRTHNLTSYETSYEGNILNLTTNSSLTAVSLLYNGTAYTMTNQGSGIWSYPRDLPTSTVGNNSIGYRFTYAGDTFDSDYTTYQNVNSILFSFCNSTLNTKYLNISFKNEENGSAVSASIPTSTFYYYLGTGLQNKSYTYINNTESSNFSFCFTPNTAQVKVNSSVSYVATGYPQRSIVQNFLLTSSVTNAIYYLLDSSSGIYVTFQVLNGANQPISNVNVKVNRTIGTTSTIINEGTTGTDGGVTFWLNPDFSHSLLFTKSGYSDYSFSLTPTQTLYTVTMGATDGNVTLDYSRGVSIRVLPSLDFLVKNTNYNFNYTISSNVWNLEEYGYTLNYSNGTVIDTQSDTTDSGGVLNTLVNVSNVSRVIMNYYYIVNSTQINGTRYWIISGTGDYSLTRLFSDISTSIDNNIYGINGSDNDSSFSKALISGLILVGVTFALSKRYGIVSEPAVVGLIFGLVLLLNELNMIPNPTLFGNAVNNFGDIITFILFVLMITFIVREER